MEKENSSIYDKINDFLRNIKKEDVEYSHEIDEQVDWFESSGIVSLPADLAIDIYKRCRKEEPHEWALERLNNGGMFLLVNEHKACITYNDGLYAQLTRFTPNNWGYGGGGGGSLIKETLKQDEFDAQAIEKAIAVCEEVFTEKENDCYVVNIDKEMADKIGAYYDDNTLPAVKIMRYDNEIQAIGTSVENGEMIFSKVGKDTPNHTIQDSLFKSDIGKPTFCQYAFYEDTKDFMRNLKSSISNDEEVENDLD